jgi:hypothetical protein
MNGLLQHVLLTQVPTWWQPVLFLIAFGVALVADAFLIWAIIKGGAREFTASNDRVVAELNRALDEARKFPSKVASAYNGVSQRLEEHDRQLRAQADRLQALEARGTRM